LHLKSNSRFFCGSASGSGFTSWFSSQRYRFEDPHLHPDPYQNVTHPEHYFLHYSCKFLINKIEDAPYLIQFQLEETITASW